MRQSASAMPLGTDAPSVVALPAPTPGARSRRLALSAAASDIVHDCCSRHDRTGAAAARSTSSAVAVDCRSPVPAPATVLSAVSTSSAGADATTIAIRAPIGDAAGDHSDASRQHDRDHIAGAPARQFIDHRMQLHAGRSADQWRGFAALDAANSGEPATRHDSARRSRELGGTSIDPTMTVMPTPNTSACAESMTMNLATPGMMAPANATGAPATPGVSPARRRAAERTGFSPHPDRSGGGRRTRPAIRPPI